VCVSVYTHTHTHTHIYLAFSVHLTSYDVHGTEFKMLEWSSDPGNLLTYTICQTAGHSITLCHTMKSTMASVIKSSHLS